MSDSAEKERGGRGSPWRAGGFPAKKPALQHMSGHPFLGLTGHSDQRLQVIETERSPVAPRARLMNGREKVVKRMDPSRGILSDHCFDVAALTLVPGSGVAESLSDNDRSTAANDLRPSASICYGRA